MSITKYNTTEATIEAEYVYKFSSALYSRSEQSVQEWALSDFVLSRIDFQSVFD